MQNRFPEQFIASLPLPLNEREALLDALNDPAPVAIRVNRAKAEILSKELTVPWHSDAYYLSERPRFTSDPSFHAGAYYVQEASSMFLAEIIEQLGLSNAPLTALDLCAAPGGKSTLLRSALHPDSLLIANEIVPARASLLEENLTKWGLPGIAITQSEASAFGEVRHIFDLIVVDAPCSGEGLFRKTPEAVNEWSVDAVRGCALRQRKILSDIWPALKPGGVLIYSTCTYNTIENDENLAWLKNELTAEPVSLHSIPDGVRKSQEEGGYRFFPHLVMGEGFFVSAVRKSSAIGTTKWPKTKPSGLSQVAPEVLGHQISAVADRDGACFLVRDADLPPVEALSGKVVFRAPGFPLGRVVNNKFKPAHGASQLVDSPWSAQSTPLDLEGALMFLERRDIYKSGIRKGLVPVQFEGFVLGFAKSDGSRLISQYPLNWRVRSGQPEARTAVVRVIG